MNLPPLAKQLKPLLRKSGQTPHNLAIRLGRRTGKGLGPALRALISAGIAQRNADGTYSKAA